MSRIGSLARQTISELGDLLSGRHGHAPDPSPHALPGAMDRDGGPDADGSQRSAYMEFFRAAQVPSDRLEEMRYYDYLERQISDVPRALTAFATMATTGNLAGGGTASYTIQRSREVDYPPALERRLDRLEQKLMAVQSFNVLREMCKYGSYMPAIRFAPSPREDNANNSPRGFAVTGLQPIPPGTIFRNIPRPGQAVDPRRYWYQQGTNDGQKWDIPQWLLPHFAIWTNTVSATEVLVYGSSVLRPFGRIGILLDAMINSMTVARLSRAAMRYVWGIDCSDINDDHKAIKRRISDWKQRLTRKTNLVGSQGNRRSHQESRIPDGDFFLPQWKDSGWSLNKIEGDQGLSRVGDVDTMFKVYFGALGVPPEYLGHERSQGGRSNLSQVDIQFARTARHLQLYGAAGWEHVVYVDMILGGWNPMDYPISVVPPPIGARDDLLQSQIRALQSSVVKSLRDAGLNLEVDPEWVMRTFMGLDEELEKLEPEARQRLFSRPESQPPPAQSIDPNADEALAVYNAVSQVNENLLATVRNNMRMLLDTSTGAAHRQNQPDPDELHHQIHANLNGSA